MRIILNFRCRISRYYGTTRPIKRELTIQVTVRSRANFAKKKCYGTSKPCKKQLTVYDTSRTRGVNKSAKTVRKQKKTKMKTKMEKKKHKEQQNQK